MLLYRRSDHFILQEYYKSITQDHKNKDQRYSVDSQRKSKDQTRSMTYIFFDLIRSKKVKDKTEQKGEQLGS